MSILTRWWSHKLQPDLVESLLDPNDDIFRDLLAEVAQRIGCYKTVLIITRDLDRQISVNTAGDDDPVVLWGMLEAGLEAIKRDGQTN